MFKMETTKHGKKRKVKKFHSVPLDQQILKESSVKTTTRQKKRKLEKEDDIFIDERTAKKILLEVEKQRGELAEGEESSLRHQKHDSESESEEDATQNSDNEDNDFEVEMNEEELSQFSKFEKCDGGNLVTEMKKKETEILTECSDAMPFKPATVIEPEMRQIYIKLGEFLSTYRSSKLPVSFKSIPRFRDWEAILELTKPANWSAAAMREATKMFISNFKEGQAARFLELYLLPRIRDEMATYKRLNPHLVEAINRALFKPLAFFEGFLLPFCSSNDCTLQEATIIAARLKKVTINMTYSASALMELLKLPYSGPTMLIIQSLLEKKYALHLPVIQAVADYFIRFKDDPDHHATVIWHQGLLTFVQLFKNDIDEERKRDLLKLLKVHRHHEITDEVRRELCAGQKQD